MTRIPVTEEMVEGAVSFEHSGGWLKPWRVPFEQRRLFPPDPGIEGTADKPAGVRLRFSTDATSINLELEPTDGRRLLDLTLGSSLVETACPEPGANEVRFGALPPGSKAIELWLPPNAAVAMRAVRINDGATLSVTPDPRPRWTTYGSSITHCMGATSPARTWPAIVAREKGLNLTCLGFSGNCHLEPMLGRLIRDIPADLVSLKLGANVLGGTLAPRTFKPAVIGLIQLIREKHPDIPLVVVSPVSSARPGENEDNMVGFCLKKIRPEVEDAVARVRECGDKNLYYVDGTELIAETETAEYLADELHPNGAGYELIAGRFLDIVFGRLGVQLDGSVMTRDAFASRVFE